MAPKLRVYELARELGMTNKETLDLCETLGIGVKSHSSSIIDAQADRVRRKAEREGLTRAEQPEEPKPAKKAPAKKAAAKKAAPAPDPTPAPIPVEAASAADLGEPQSADGEASTAAPGVPPAADATGGPSAATPAASRPPIEGRVISNKPAEPPRRAEVDTPPPAANPPGMGGRVAAARPAPSSPTPVPGVGPGVPPRPGGAPRPPGMPPGAPGGPPMSRRPPDPAASRSTDVALGQADPATAGCGRSRTDDAARS
ncbi:MAG: translation initiation factor IF-2 N-terminal domain-containing protein [Microthrixaceae bacterium]